MSKADAAKALSHPGPCPSSGSGVSGDSPAPNGSCFDLPTSKGAFSLPCHSHSTARHSMGHSVGWGWHTLGWQALTPLTLPASPSMSSVFFHEKIERKIGERSEEREERKEKLLGH